MLKMSNDLGTVSGPQNLRWLGRIFSLDRGTWESQWNRDETINEDLIRQGIQNILNEYEDL